LEQYKMTNPTKTGFSRRDFLKTSLAAGAGVWLGGCAAQKPPLSALHSAAAPTMSGITVNDIHSQLNQTVVQQILTPSSIDECRSIIRAARQAGKALSVAGGRHSMGGQQFADGSLLVDTRSFNHVLSFDRERGLIDVEAGIEWPELIQYLHREVETCYPQFQQFLQLKRQYDPAGLFQSNWYRHYQKMFS